MSDDAFGSELQPDAGAHHSANGVATADKEAEEPTAAAAESSESAEGAKSTESAEAAASEATTEPATERETASGDAIAVAADPSADSATAGPATSQSPDFLARLATAMQETAGAERSRVGEDIDRRRTEHLATIQARRESEVTRMRDLAKDDRAAIDTWAEEERRRIQTERDRRMADVEADLESSLREHGKSVDEQVERVEAAIAGHRREIDGFFSTLGSETDPVRIAQLAGQRPVFPDLEAAGASAHTTEPSVAAAAPPTETTASSEPSPAAALTTGVQDASGSGVPVMSPIARLGLLRGGLQESTATVEGAEANATADATRDAAATAARTRMPAGAWRPSPEVLVPAARTSARPEEAAAPADQASSSDPAAAAGSPSGGIKPMSWLRRKDENGER